MTPLELETTGGLVRNDDRDSQDDKRKADNNSVDDLAELILRLVDLVEPVHDRQHQQQTACADEELHGSGVEDIGNSI